MLQCSRHLVNRQPYSFSFETDLWRVKAHPQIELWERTVNGAGLHTSLILVIASRGERDNSDPGWFRCRGPVPSARTLQSLVTGDAFGMRTTAATSAYGFDAGFAAAATGPSRSCLTGWCRSLTTACVAGNKPARESAVVTRRSRQHHAAKIRRAYPIPPPYAVGHGDESSARGAG